MTALLLAAMAWILLHVVVAGPLRPSLVRRLGLPAYRGVFSLLSALFLVALIWAFAAAPHVELWPASPALSVIPLVVMPVAFLFLVGSLRPSNPTLAGPDMVMEGELPVTGFTRITRHPMLWAFSLWALAHMAANGDVATLTLAGAILITALNGMVSIDRKRAAAFGERWQRFAAKTSIIPFSAVAAGRTPLRFADIGWLNIAVAAVLYGLFLWLHDKFFGVPAYPSL